MPSNVSSFIVREPIGWFFTLTRLGSVACREHPDLLYPLRLLTKFCLHDSMLTVNAHSYFERLDRNSVSALVSSTLHHQVGALRNALYNHIACKAAMRVVIPVFKTMNTPFTYS